MTGFVGKEAEDMCIQKAYGILQKRGYQLELNTCYYSLLGILQRDGLKALYEYAGSVNISKS